MLTSPSGNNGLERLNLGMPGPREKNVTFIPIEGSVEPAHGRSGPGNATSLITAYSVEVVTVSRPDATLASAAPQYSRNTSPPSGTIDVTKVVRYRWTW